MITLFGIYSLEGLFGHRKDVDKALVLLKDAHQKGDIGAALSLGMMSLGGFNLSRDILQNDKLLRFSAENSSPIACFYPGNLYAQGYGVSKEKAEAEKLFLIAANDGHEKAQLVTGMRYMDDNGVAKAPTESNGDSIVLEKMIRISARFTNTANANDIFDKPQCQSARPRQEDGSLLHHRQPWHNTMQRLIRSQN